MSDSRKNFELYQAAKNGNLQKVQTLIDEKIPLDLQFNKDGNIESFSQTALYAAALAGHTLIVKALLAAGANPNVLCTKKRTALHVATFKNYHEIMNLLIQHQANFEIKDINGLTPLGYASSQNENTQQLLLKAGAQVHEDKSQKTFIENYNLFITELKKNAPLSNKFDNLVPLNEGGCCDGLCKTFVKFRNQGLSEQFDLYVGFFNRLKPQEIKNLAKEYAENPHTLEVNLLKNDKQRVSAEKKIIYLDKIINDFIMPINIIQTKQTITRYKSINANWDSTSTITSSNKNLEDTLIKVGVMSKEGEKFIASSNHITTLCVLKNGAIFYDPRFAEGAQFFKNEKELAAALESFIDSHNDRLIFEIDEVSFKETNKNLTSFEEILENHADRIKENTEMQSLKQRFEQGQLSQRDTALILHYQIVQSATSIEFTPLKIQLEDYLVHHPNKSNVDLLDKIHTENVFTPLHFACYNGNFELVHDIITNNPKIDVNVQNKVDGHTPLHAAIAANHVDIVRYLLSAGADVSIKTKDGLTPMQIATQLNTQEIIQLLRNQEIVDGFEAKSNMHDADQIAVKLYKFFDSIAHPGFLSKEWTVNRPHYRIIASLIAEKLKMHPEWSGAECKQCINQEINAHVSKTTRQDKVENIHVFNGILRRAQFILDLDQSQVQVQANIHKLQ